MRPANNHVALREGYRLRTGRGGNKSISTTSRKFTFRECFTSGGRRSRGAGGYHKIWQVRGQEETGARVFAAAAAEKMARTGIESDQSLSFQLQPIMYDGVLPPGNYVLRLLLLDPDSTVASQRIFTVSQGATSDTVDIFKEAGGANRLLERVYPVTLRESAAVTVTLAPVKGKVVISGVVLEPKNSAR